MTQATAPSSAEFRNNPHYPPSRQADVDALQSTELAPNQMLAPQTLGQALEWARILCDAEIVPKAYRGQPADVLTCILFGKNLGLDVVQSLQNVVVVNGKATVYGDALLGVVLSKMTPKERETFLETFDETWDPELAGGTATCTARRGSRVRTLSFSMDEARKIQTTEADWTGVPQGGRPNHKKKALAEKDTYQNYPRRMCKFKARNEVLRDLFPDFLLGIIPREDAEDYVEAVGYQVEKAPGEPIRVEGLEDLIGEMDPDDAAAVEAGFLKLNLSRAQKMVELRKHRGDVGALLQSLRDEYALRLTRGAKHAPERADSPARRARVAEALGASVDEALARAPRVVQELGSVAADSGTVATVPASGGATAASGVLF